MFIKKLIIVKRNISLFWDQYIYGLWRRLRYTYLFFKYYSKPYITHKINTDSLPSVKTQDEIAFFLKLLNEQFESDICLTIKSRKK